MANDAYTIRTAAPAEIDQIVHWAADQGWNPGLHDADCCRRADPDRFLIGHLGGTPITSTSAARRDRGPSWDPPLDRAYAVASIEVP